MYKAFSHHNLLAGSHCLFHIEILCFGSGAAYSYPAARTEPQNERQRVQLKYEHNPRTIRAAYVNSVNHGIPTGTASCVLSICTESIYSEKGEYFFEYLLPLGKPARTNLV